MPYSRSSIIQAPNAPGTHAASSPLPGTRSSPRLAKASGVAAAERFLPAEHEGLAAAGVMGDDRDLPAEAVQVRLDHLKHEPGRDGRVERVTAVLEDRQPGRRGEPCVEATMPNVQPARAWS